MNALEVNMVPKSKQIHTGWLADGRVGLLEVLEEQSGEVGVASVKQGAEMNRTVHILHLGRSREVS